MERIQNYWTENSEIDMQNYYNLTEFAIKTCLHDKYKAEPVEVTIRVAWSISSMKMKPTTSDKPTDL